MDFRSGFFVWHIKMKVTADLLEEATVVAEEQVETSEFVVFNVQKQTFP